MEPDTLVNTPAPESAPQPEPQSEPAPKAEPQEGPRLAVDERTGRRRVVGFEPPAPRESEQKFPEVPEKAEPPEEAKPVETPKVPEVPEPGDSELLNKLSGIQPKPNYYSPEELSLAMQLKNVDESRIPPQYKAQYDALKPKPPTQADVESQIRAKIQSMAQAEAMKKSGCTQEDLEMGEFSDDPDVAKRVQDYKVAYEMAQQQIIRDSTMAYQRAQAEQAKRMQVMQNVQNFVNTQRQQEPHFDEIGKFMETYFQSLPYKQATLVAPCLEAAMKGNLTQAQADILGEYYKICRKEFYARLNHTSTTPTPKAPRVETRGNGASASPQTDYASMLRNASMRNKSRILAAWLQSAKKEN